MPHARGTQKQTRKGTDLEENRLLIAATTIAATVRAPRTLLIALASAAVVVGAAGCGTSNTSHATAPGNPISTTSASAAASPPSACADIGGTIEADQTCHLFSETPYFTLDFQFPVDYPDQHALGDYLTQRRHGFVEWVAGLPPSTSFALHIIGHSYQSGTPTSGTRSLVLTIGTDGGVHPVTTYTAFNYDLTRKAPITFDTLFKPGTQPLDVLNPIIQRAWEDRGGTGSLSFDDLDPRAYENFSLTNDAVIFFFNQDGLLPHEAGDLEVTVPRSKIESLLA